MIYKLLYVIRAVIYTWYLIITTIPLFLILALSHPLRIAGFSLGDKARSFVKEAWSHSMFFIFHILAPTKFIIWFDENDSLSAAYCSKLFSMKSSVPSNKVIFMGNHQLYADWLYYWWIIDCVSHGSDIVIMLKDSLRKIPVIGWAMDMFEFVFVKREWRYDSTNIEKKLKSIDKWNNAAFLIFPEGTTYSDQTKASSDAYAKKHDLPLTKHVLLPRVTGLFNCLTLAHWDAIIDITIGVEGLKAYEDPKKFALRSLLFEGKPPKAIHVKIKYYQASDIPSDKSEFSDWLFERFREKDKQMNKFYRHGGFDGVMVESAWKKKRWYLILSWCIICMLYVGIFIMP
ncbi:hypothetical protein ROZALSC1DRAFT_29302 [Rozella allomycis CSF55]|uniref:Phospholipid/glycerol acyltransferase domain-containing protein n=1 Tax=Rozella allomycis (strain CSF55) TaxID=988480 RepID=A0A4P9YJ22_ROZAC|nr:hypothetical protein ROZALSC1DRAFT_29302 [Rozella allomycis CSF55]